MAKNERTGKAIATLAGEVLGGKKARWPRRGGLPGRR